MRGRGTSINPKNRFHSEHSEPDSEDEFEDDDFAETNPKTEFLTDHSKSVLSFNKSPDLPYEVGLNPYRGCEHGCTYCYARPTHEYLGYSSGLDFERKIVVKKNAPELLEQVFRRTSWQPKVVVMSGVTDPYQPVERRLQLTRRCLEMFAKYKNPVSLITKNFLVTRDCDLLKDLAKANAVRVYLSINSLDAKLANRLEPRASSPKRRLQAVELLSKKGVPVSIMLAPIIPGLNEKDVVPIVEAAANSGAQSATYTLVRLPYQNQTLFEDWLKQHYPMRFAKVMQRIRDVRRGDVNNNTFHERFKGHGEHANMVRQMFRIACQKHGLATRATPLNTTAFRRPNPSSSKGQMLLV